MRYLTRKASKDYFSLSRLSYVCHFIGWTHFLDRLVVLKELTRPKDPIHIRARRILEIEEWVQNTQWADELGDEITSKSIKPIVQKASINENTKGGDVISFFIAGISGLQNWHFHQYDDDYFPSIPHGHWEGRKYPKLDSYLGWVYEGSRQIKRERRSLILMLWNDEKFRIFAKTAIEYYLVHHPDYMGWRVSNPLNLPRKR